MYQFLRTSLIVLTFAAFVQGCGNSDKTLVIDPRTGTESSAVTVTVRSGYFGAPPLGESAQTYLGGGDIIAITSRVETYKVHVTLSEPVASAQMSFSDNSGFYETSVASITTKSKNIVFEATNGGFLFALRRNKSLVSYNLSVDTIGLAGKVLEWGITGIEVTTDVTPTRHTLRVQDANLWVEIAETPRAYGSAITKSYTYSVKGTSDEVAGFQVEDTSSRPINLRELYIWCDATGVSFELETASGAIVKTVSGSPYNPNEYFFYLEDNQAQPLHAELVIPAGGTNRFRLRADTSNATLVNNQLTVIIDYGYVKSDQNVVGQFAGVRNPDTSQVLFITNY